MNITVINGSPRGVGSNSWKLTQAFLDGIREAKANAEVSVFHLSQLDIQSCRGCFACWSATPGKCCISDDVEKILQNSLGADLIIWSFPLYYFSVPGLLKNFIDRRLPMVSPFMDPNAENGGHESRYDLTGQKNVLISTCGFHTAEGNYDSVSGMFDHFLGKGNYETIFSGQGELFRVPQLEQFTGEYLKNVRLAGMQYADGGIAAETRERLKTPLLPREVFEKLADQSW